MYHLQGPLVQRLIQDLKLIKSFFVKMLVKADHFKDKSRQKMFENCSFDKLVIYGLNFM